MEHSPALERELLRKGVGARVQADHRCADCGRTPLIGETVYHYARGSMRCELCRPLSRKEPIRSELVHGPEYGHCVLRVTRVAASA